MSARSNNTRPDSKQFYGRFHSSVRWRAAKKQDWENMVPVGREFGGPEFERLSVPVGHAQTTPVTAYRLHIASRSGSTPSVFGMKTSTPKPSSLMMKTIS